MVEPLDVIFRVGTQELNSVTEVAAAAARAGTDAEVLFAPAVILLSGALSGADSNGHFWRASCMRESCRGPVRSLP